jgi:hypothetical protein
MKRLTDWLFGKNRYCSYGKIHLLTKDGAPVTISKEIRYTVRCNGSEVHINEYDDLLGYCKASQFTTADSKHL